MSFNTGNRGAASSQNWRANASPNTSTDSWRRRSSGDSGYETALSRSISPRPSSFSRCDCHLYNETYRSYKEQERTVRRWLCSQTERACPESDLDNIDVGSLVRMAKRLGRGSVPFSVSQGLRKAIHGRKAVIGTWHREDADHTCAACGRVWRRIDEAHKHHIRELERMLEILGIVEPSVKPRVDPKSLRSWR